MAPTPGYPVRIVEYISAAPADEVMFEQLEFLLRHYRRGCHLDQCPECSRLARVAAWLLAPFV